MLDDRVLWGGWLAVVTGVLVAFPPLPDLPADTGERAYVAATPLPNSDANAAVARAADGLFYVTGAVNGVPVRFLVDTGASSVVLSPADARRAGIDPARLGWSASMSTTAGSVAMAWSRADRLAVMGRELHDIDVAVPDSTLPVSLLGQNALAQLGPLTLEGDHLRLSENRDSLR